MPANAFNRKVARKRLIVHFETDLVGTGLPVKAVYSHDVADFKGIQPAVVVRTAGRRRVPLGQGTPVPYDNWFDMAILLYVSKPTSSWTSEQAADALDDCEAAIANSIMNHRSDHPYWTNLIPIDEYSNIYDVTVDGKPFTLEIIGARAHIKDQ